MDIVSAKVVFPGLPQLNLTNVLVHHRSLERELAEQDEDNFIRQAELVLKLHAVLKSRLEP